MKTAEAQSKDVVIRPEMLLWMERRREVNTGSFFLDGRMDGRAGITRMSSLAGGLTSRHFSVCPRVLRQGERNWKPGPKNLEERKN